MYRPAHETAFAMARTAACTRALPPRRFSASDAPIQQAGRSLGKEAAPGCPSRLGSWLEASRLGS